MRRIGLFYKSPQPGTVKTRLCPPLTPAGAAGLYAAFLEDAAAICRSLPAAELLLFEAPSPHGRVSEPPVVEAPAGTSRLPRFEQAGPDLGARMDQAFGRLLTRPGDRALIFGSDAPTVPAIYLETAFEKLAENDVVLGPASDGGYYLIGLTRRCPELFEGMAWSGANVFLDTASRAASLGLACMTLPSWYDVDTPADLDHLVRELRGNKSLENAAPATRRALARLGLIPAC